MYKKLLGFLSVAVILGFFVPTLALADGTVDVDTINGVSTTTNTIPCIAGPIAITGHGITGQQGGTWHVSIGWGDGVTTFVTVTSGSLTGSNSPFTFSASHTPVGASTGLSMILYHSQASGLDGKVTIISQCIAPPTTAVLTVKKHVVNDNLFPGTAVASDFTLHVKNSSSADVPNGGNGVSSPAAGSETGKDFIITPAGGAYTVSENPFTGYTGTFSGDCLANGSVTLAVGHNYTCTITNNDDVIKTNPTLSVTNSPVVYNGSMQSATITGSVAGVVTDIKYNGSSVAPIDTGTYAVTADFTPTDTVNYNSLNDASAGNFVINQATSTTTITCSNVTYNGTAQTPCTVSVTGTGGLSLTPAPVYSNNTNAGTASVSYSYAGDANHTASSDSKIFTIAKADATILVVPYLVTYDGNSHTATGTATGVLGENLSASLDLSGTTHTIAGYGNDPWIFTGGTNYNNANDTVADQISKADADCSSIAGYSGTYDGAAHGATGVCNGINGSTLPGLDLGSTFTDVPGGSADWTFTDTTGNYNDQSGSVNIDITAQDVAVTADAKSKTYGDSDPALTFGFSGQTVSAGDFTGALDRDPGEDVATYAINQGTLALNSNYNLIYTGNFLNIGSQAALNVTADNQSMTYGDSDPSFTFSYSGFKNGDDESVIDTAPTCEVSGSHINVGSYTIDCSGGSDNNYSFSYTSGSLTVNAKTITVTADSQTKVYGSADPALTYQASGLVGSDTLSGALVRSIGENVGTYAINQGTLANANYNISYVSADLTITKADQAITFASLGDKTMGDADFTVSAISNSGLPVTFTAGGSCSISGDTVHITATNICTITAHQSGDNNYNAAPDVSQSFTIATLLHTVTASAGANGTISPQGAVSVADGSDKMFTITSDSGYHIADVLVDNSSVGAVASYNFTNVTADHTILATFDADPVADACPNISGNQTSVPRGYHLLRGNCIKNSSTVGGSIAPVGQVLGAETSCGIYLDKYLRMGYQNDKSAVTKVQQFLNDYLKAGLTLDGVFGKNTDKWVKSFQSAHADKILTPWHLTAPTGIVYLTTTTEINNIMCPDLKLPTPTNLIPWTQGAQVAGN